MNVIDSLTVTLGLDASKFKAGSAQTQKSLHDTEQVANRTAKNMQADGDKAAEFFSRVKIEALGLIGVLVGAGGIEAFARSATDSLAGLGREAKNIGMTVPDLAAFRNMIERNGGSAESATASFKGFADQIERFKVFGDPTVLQYLNPIGASVNDSPLAAYMKFVKFVEDHKNLAGGMQLINLIGHGLGYDQGLINATIQIKTLANAQKELAESYSLGVPLQGDVDRVTALQKAFIGLGQAAQFDGIIMLTDMAPGLTAVADAMTKSIEKNPKALVGWATLAGILTTIAALNFSTLLAFVAAMARIPLPLLAFVMALNGGSLNDGEHTELNKWRKTQGLPPLPPGGAGKPFTETPGTIPFDQRDALLARAVAGTPIPPDLLNALIETESGWNPNSVSSTGALGLTQVLPSTALQPGYGVLPVAPALLLDPSISAEFGAHYLAARGAALGVTDWNNPTQRDRALRAYHGAGDASDAAYAASVERKLHALPNRPIPPPPGHSLTQVLHRLRAQQTSAAPAGGATTITVGSISVHTQAADAKGIAHDIYGALVDQANRGLA